VGSASARHHDQCCRSTEGRLSAKENIVNTSLLHELDIPASREVSEPDSTPATTPASPAPEELRVAMYRALFDDVRPAWEVYVASRA
jgi:hypothetical protein